METFGIIADICRILVTVWLLIWLIGAYYGRYEHPDTRTTLLILAVGVLS